MRIAAKVPSAHYADQVAKGVQASQNGLEWGCESCLSPLRYKQI